MSNRKYASVLCLVPLMVSARTDFIPHAQIRYEDNSNVFATNESNPFTDSSGQLRFQDRYMNIGAGLDINHLWRENKAYLTTDYRRYAYDHFEQLDRNEYTIVAGTELTVTRRLTAGATARYEQQQVPFSEVGIIPNSSEVLPAYKRINRIMNVSTGYRVLPRWQINANTGYALSSLPLYEVKEQPWHVDLKYLGDGRFTSTLAVEGNDGKYEGVADEPAFHQTQAQISADYKLGGRSVISGSLGKSRRTQPGFKLNATTGALSFSQQLTAKTSYYIQYRRALNGYLTSQGAQLDKTIQGGLTWHPRVKWSMTASYAYSQSEVQGVFDQNNALVIGGRDDRTHTYGGSVTYSMTKWLSVTPYYRNDKRESTLVDFSYQGRLYGLELAARFE